MRDLFGDVVVTHDDLHAWVEAVAPAFAINTRSFDHYVRNWSVIDKVRTAKLDGTFDSTVETSNARNNALLSRFGLGHFGSRRRTFGD